MVLVCGTSTCHMAVSRNKLFIPGVWGPFWSGTSINFLSVFCSESLCEDLELSCAQTLAYMNFLYIYLFVFRILKGFFATYFNSFSNSNLHEISYHKFHFAMDQSLGHLDFKDSSLTKLN